MKLKLIHEYFLRHKTKNLVLKLYSIFTNTRARLNINDTENMLAF